ncbi:MAG: hypothetical protein J1E98_05195 [Lachnospiraceae bacterium]|nr:hypothetical protein [Lachnospiraceae bacterium]
MNNSLLSEYIDGEHKNFFNVEKEFFLIDNNNLTDIHSRLYGFSVQDSGIYENENLTQGAVAQMEGCGCYVYVDVKDDEIIIKQDFNGSWGIYFFQYEDYFAISNSFFRLLDHIKKEYPISLDRDYCNHIIVDNLASLTCSETPVKEIKLIAKNAVIKIDILKKQLYFDYIDYKEDSFSLNSEEGLAVLDHWFERWTTLFKKLKEKTGNIMATLSGGFDSRITFLLLLCSGIDLNEICVHSIDSNLKTYAEDYKIATSIAEYYGFKLNCFNFSSSAIHYSLQDVINIVFYTKMGFHKEMYFKLNKLEEKRYVIAGAGGESVRAHWDVPADKFIQDHVNRANRYSSNLAKEMGDSIDKLLGEAYEIIENNFHINDENSIQYPLYIHRENRCRSHFGKGAVEGYFANKYTLQPLIDPDLRRIRLYEPECRDNNLLMAMIYVRYCPKLLEFEFEGNRSISKDTIAFANQINNKFPYSPLKDVIPSDENFSVITKDSKVSELLEKNNLLITAEMVRNYLKGAFDSVGFRKLFAMYFDEEIYHFAKQSYEIANYYPMRECYSTLAIGKVIEDIFVSENTRHPMISQNLDYFIKNNCYQPNYDKKIEVLDKFKDYLTARIDVKFKGNERSDIEIVDISDPTAKILKPIRLQREGTCTVIESYMGSIDISLKAKIAGEISIELKGRFVWGQDKDTDRIPYWIDYHFCQINNSVEFSEIKPAWHDRPICFSRLMAQGDNLTLRLTWSPHRSDMV